MFDRPEHDGDDAKGPKVFPITLSGQRARPFTVNYRYNEARNREDIFLAAAWRSAECQAPFKPPSLLVAFMSSVTYSLTIFPDP